MKCEDLKELISAYVDNELLQTQRDFVEEHITHCRDCQMTFAEYTRISHQMSSLRLTPSLPDIKEGIMSKIRMENVLSKPRKWLRPVLIATPVVLILAILLPILLLNTALTPEKVLARAQAALTSVQSYRTIDKAYDYDPSTKDMSIQIYQAEAETDVTGGHFHFKKSGLSSGYFNEQIVVGQQVYVQGDFSATLTVAEIQAKIPSAKITQERLDMLVKIEALPDENIDGVACFHYRGTVDTEKFIQLQKEFWKRTFKESPLLDIIDHLDEIWRARKVTWEFWVGKDDYIIRQWKELITDVMGEINDSSITEIIKYYDFNAPISIEPPLDAAGNLLPGWSIKTEK
jgi:negative regulator of sigma E activity